MSNQRKSYHVVPDGEGWAVRFENNRVSLAHVEDKGEAVRRAREIARAEGHCQLLVHGLDGRIQDESTDADDPYPPAG
jgi:hypothetical protein